MSVSDKQPMHHWIEMQPLLPRQSASPAISGDASTELSHITGVSHEILTLQPHHSEKTTKDLHTSDPANDPTTQKSTNLAIRFFTALWAGLTTIAHTLRNPQQQLRQHRALEIIKQQVDHPQSFTTIETKLLQAYFQQPIREQGINELKKLTNDTNTLDIATRIVVILDDTHNVGSKESINLLAYELVPPKLNAQASLHLLQRLIPEKLATSKQSEAISILRGDTIFIKLLSKFYETMLSPAMSPAFAKEFQQILKALPNTAYDLIDNPTDQASFNAKVYEIMSKLTALVKSDKFPNEIKQLNATLFNTCQQNDKIHEKAAIFTRQPFFLRFIGAIISGGFKSQYNINDEQRAAALQISSALQQISNETKTERGSTLKAFTAELNHAQSIYNYGAQRDEITQALITPSPT